ncbi:dynein axonemal intermediate chain 7 isoform X6 [Mustela putorius furo]|uniref:Dynein axonemal intermediate chain 7 n=1 Tax=Mustela putorius furo TaxID=9669 RepID=A0A8U0TA95_MUSPF|nr:dynein axonemal intermediate chain 7 isoform X6 [Mustela putorius furo]
MLSLFFATTNKSGKKKRKITKAERLKQLQEEEERRQKEEEEARVKYEKEEMERLEIQRIEKEKWHQLEAKDLERRHEELEELCLLEGCFPEAEKLKRDTRLLSQWKHYIQCDGSPDPSISPEINTFISLWKEETNETLEEVIAKSKLVLKQASTLADLDSGNMEKVIQDENVTLYVWANLKKNPRYKSVRFSETQIGFEIPRILATSDIALRLLHTHYDHVTPLRPVPTSLREYTATVNHLVKDEVKYEETAVDKELQEEGKQQENESNSVDEEQTKFEEQSGSEVQRSFVQEESEATKCEVEMKLLSETVLSAQFLLIKNANEKPYIFEDNEVDLCQFTTLGGVYHLDILELPPQCKPMKGWMIVEILKEGLQKYIYPPETTEDVETENAFPPIEVTLEVQENVILFEDPMVARWDAEGKHWQTDGISNVSYKPEDRLVTFSLETFGPVTLIQDAHINMPFQSWELTPLDVDQVLLTVTTVFTTIQIQIKENLCLLASITLSNKKHFSILEGKWMTPISFICALKEAGLNIFPSEHSHFYVVINYKDPLIEMKAYRQLALLSSAFAFGWSKWNIVCSSNKVIVKLKEHLSEKPIQKPNWTLLMFSGDRAQRLKINENSETFSEALKEETEFHSTLYHMVKDFASQKAMEKVRSSSCQLIDSVCYMLLSTRVLSYS